MPFVSSSNPPYFQFESLTHPGLHHAVFTRRGGTSPAPWHSLNVGWEVGDEATRVRANHARALQALGRPPESLFPVAQVHGNRVLWADSLPPAGTAPPEGDAVLTRNPRLTLFMRFADCVPILLFDPEKRVAGLAHAGWRGTVHKVAAAAVEAMQTVSGSRLADIRAAIGPSICAAHYEIGPEVAAQVRAAFPGDASVLLPSKGAKIQFDLWKANQLVLAGAGVRQIETASLCTACHLDDWYSHRAENGATGRFGALIGLAE